ncbi:hypothetical protein BCR33DRAFT_233584 [Rhizoclosmatium globosum]|uniref:Uncharacterized protein n=1 Tax=Rhizoclosmatium globosum TaxID=329046 RepID=A0A1Y2CAH2_9FUNG|nr:hypothetical protein BCR33DRAFT_233584 [Rhizoclosmatium globosum]|eukprot:ORY44029.1 hypothetical protein BCR33DRAFT_233584 [Rhizoclosmatium globosum]
MPPNSAWNLASQLVMMQSKALQHHSNPTSSGISPTNSLFDKSSITNVESNPTDLGIRPVTSQTPNPATTAPSHQTQSPNKPAETNQANASTLDRGRSVRNSLCSCFRGYGFLRFG